MDQDYEKLRQSYKPAVIKWLFVTESPPPQAGTTSTRHFYRAEAGEGDRLFVNTIKGLYPEAKLQSEAGIAKDKSKWLDRLKADGVYQIESLIESMPHGSSQAVRREALKAAGPDLIKRIQGLISLDTKIILVKSTVYNYLGKALKDAKLPVINEALLDYPGFWREQPYQAKLSALMAKNGWKPK